MASIAHKDFMELLPDGSNYLTWSMDMKIYLSSKGYVAAIQEPNLNNAAPEVTDAVKFSSSTVTPQIGVTLQSIW